jgi:L-histidine Nalpha-methyltransferase / hercynylcysteine S-oxide synthase
VIYYALDLMESELQRTLAQVPQYEYVKCLGLLGTYDDGFTWLRKPQNVDKRKTILSLGSSIGNFTREEAVEFVKQIFSALGPDDKALIGIDACRDPDRVYRAYNDVEG